MVCDRQCVYYLFGADRARRVSSDSRARIRCGKSSGAALTKGSPEKAIALAEQAVLAVTPLAEVDADDSNGPDIAVLLKAALRSLDRS